MREILKTLKVKGLDGVASRYLILSCGHWYHWTGKDAPTGDDFKCPGCYLPAVSFGATEEKS